MDYKKQLQESLKTMKTLNAKFTKDIEGFFGPGRSSSFSGKYSYKELKMGIEVEKEHTNDPNIAKRIAKDHLAEIPDYYTRLAQMEKEGRRFHGVSEHTDMYRMGGGMRGGMDRKPSPVAAFELVYGKKPPSNMRGMYPGQSEHKNWNGISIDSHIEDKWLDDLNKIKQIEMRASCEGHDKQWVTFIVFRVMPNKDKDTKYLDKIKSILNQGMIKCGYEIGQQGRPRFIITAKLWYGQPGWEKFWSTLATRVQQAVR